MLTESVYDVSGEMFGMTDQKTAINYRQLRYPLCRTLYVSKLL